MDIITLGHEIAQRRKKVGLTQTALATQASISRATLSALESGRLGELGFGKIMNILTALKLDLALTKSSTQRPTLDDLIRERDDD